MKKIEERRLQAFSMRFLLKNKKCLLSLLVGVFWLGNASALSANNTSNQNLIPGAGSLYYRIGGGDVTPLPYDSGTTTALTVGGDASLGFNCGVFNELSTIINSLNSLDSSSGLSYGDITNQVYQHLTGMIIGEGGYLLAKAMPNVYKYARDGISMGQSQFGYGMKSCQTMLHEVDQGKNPNYNMMHVAMGQDWQYYMSLADTEAGRAGLLGSKVGDIVDANAAVNKNAGKNGVQWVQGVQRNGQLMAGGQNQPSIQLTRDTVIAGYNVLIGEGRAYDDQTTPEATPDNAGITGVFKNPMSAANFAIYVIGEHTITTYQGGTKSTTPGHGLLHDINVQSQTVSKILTQLVTGEIPLTLKNLHQLDSPTITINAEVIHAIQRLNSPTLEAIWIHHLAQGIAANRVINSANLLRQFLIVGAQVPAIGENSVAQQAINNDIDHLNLFVSSIESAPGNTKNFLANSVSALLQAVRQKELVNVQTQPSSQMPVIQRGAMMKSNED